MSLKERINADYITAFKSKDMIAKNLLSVIKGEIQTIEKNTLVESLADTDVIKILSKTRKSLEETGSKFPSDQVKKEISIVESYLPVEMSESDIKSKVEELISGGASSIGDIMKGFNGLNADKKKVSVIYQSLK